MKKNQLLFLVLALLAVFSACTKDKDPAPLTKAQVIANKTWKITASKLNPPLVLTDTSGNTTVIQDLFEEFGPCYQDNIIKFNTNPNTYTIEEGETPCDAEDDRVSDSGTWVLSSDEKVIVATSGWGYIRNYRIIDDNTIEVSFPFQIAQGYPVLTWTNTYKAQ